MKPGFCWVAVACMLSACAGLAPLPAKRHDMPLLKLSPASAGRNIDVAQHLDAEMNGRRVSVDALLEVDARAVRLALLQFGQPVARLDWDGMTLHEDRLPGVPPELNAQRVLSEVQLVQWPAAAIQSALGDDWQLSESGTGSQRQRELAQGGEIVMRIRYPSADDAELDNLRDGYRLHIVSQPIGAP